MLTNSPRERVTEVLVCGAEPVQTGPHSLQLTMNSLKEDMRYPLESNIYKYCFDLFTSSNEFQFS